MIIKSSLPPKNLFKKDFPLFYLLRSTIFRNAYSKLIFCVLLSFIFSCKQELKNTNGSDPPTIYFSKNWKIDCVFVNNTNLINPVCSMKLFEIFVSDSTGISKWIFNYDGSVSRKAERVFNKTGLNSPAVFGNKLWGVVSIENFKYGGQINFYSFDGKSFSGPYQIRDVNWGEFQAPVFCSDLKNCVYCVWTDGRNGNRDIYFSASYDKGKAWSENIKINNDNSGQEQTAGNIICADNGKLTVTWYDNRNSKTLFDLYSSTSMDNGKTWNGNVKINDDTTQSWQMISFAGKNKDGNIYIVWTDYRNVNPRGEHIAGIYFSRSEDYGKSWIHNVPIHIPSKGNDTYPVLYVSPNENINCAWLSNEDNQMGDVMFSYSTNYGNNWSEATTVNDDFERAKHGIAFIFQNENKNIVVGCFDLRESNMKIYLAESRVAEDTSRNKREHPIVSEPEEKYQRYFFNEGKVLFADKFENGKQTGWENADGYWIVFENSLIGYGVNEARSFAGSNNWNDYKYEGQFKLDATDHRAAYIYFYVQNKNNSYKYYRVRNYFKNGVVIEHFNGKNLIPVIESPFLIQSDKWYNFRIEVKDNFLNYFLDDKHILSTDKISEISGGRIGVGAFYSPAYFRNILVTEIK